MKVYVLIQYNGVGGEIIGVFKDKKAAEAKADQYNAASHSSAYQQEVHEFELI